MKRETIRPAQRVIAIVGVPWSRAELRQAVAAAREHSSCVLVADTAQALSIADVPPDCTPISVQSLDPIAVFEALSSWRPHTVMSISELYMVLAAEVRQRFGQDGTSVEIEKRVRNKFESRQVLIEHGLTRGLATQCTLDKVEEVLTAAQLPVVVKPEQFTGSHGVYSLHHAGGIPHVMNALAQDFDAAEALRTGRNRLVVETFFDGPEISIEGLVTNGAAHLLMVTDKLTMAPAAHFEAGHVMPSKYLKDSRSKFVDFLQSITDAFGISDSAIHLEARLTSHGPEMIEIHTRFGGGTLVQLLGETLGVDPYSLLLNMYCTGAGSAASLQAIGTRGVGFYAVRRDRPAVWSDFTVPHPSAVRQISLDFESAPPVVSHEGIHLGQWRAGAARFAGTYDVVYANVAAMRDVAKRQWES